ncbi:hypothetical protein FKM82_013828 [Ascaphus truei]
MQNKKKSIYTYISTGGGKHRGGSNSCFFFPAEKIVLEQDFPKNLSQPQFAKKVTLLSSDTCKTQHCKLVIRRLNVLQFRARLNIEEFLRLCF